MPDELPTSGADPFEAAFPLTADERARLEAAPFPNNPEHWKWFAVGASTALLESYATGGMDFQRMLATMRGCAMGCPASYRLTTLGAVAERALKITPAKARTRHYPEALQRFVAGLIEFLREERTGEKLQTILDEALTWLVAVGICDTTTPLDTGTLHNWYLKHKRAVGDPIVRGRPRDLPQ